MPITLKAIRRYPIKGLGFESLDTVTLENRGAITGDRQYALASPEHAEQALSDHWLEKRALIATDRCPVLACVELQRDGGGAGVKLYRHGKLLGSGDPSNAAGRHALEQVLTTLLADTDPRPPRLPRLVGHASSRFTDARQALLSIVCLPSLEALSLAVGQAVDVRRFRANLILEGGLPWQELDWTNDVLYIGEAQLKVVEPILRCSAIHANPVSGEADINLLRPLARLVDEPVFGIYAEVINGGTIRTGDPVRAPSGGGRFPDRSKLA